MTSRRSLLKAVAILPVINACSSTGSASSSSNINYTPSGLPLRRVNVSDSRIIRTVSGLRPFRREGFVVKGERIGDKTVVHNYGHGGGGITLSWGSSHLVMEIAQQAAHKKCAVLGCGVMGLTSARLLQDQGWDVTIYAKALPPHTTSNIAGGQWSPASVYEDASLTPEFQRQFEAAMKFSTAIFKTLLGPNTESAGLVITSYQMSHDPPMIWSIIIRACIHS
jgi:D-amino-acid oxidase